MPTGIACKKPGDPDEHPDGYRKKSNGHPLKTAHRSPVYLHAVREEPILFRAHRGYRLNGRTPATVFTGAVAA